VLVKAKDTQEPGEGYFYFVRMQYSKKQKGKIKDRFSCTAWYHLLRKIRSNYERRRKAFI
jgi:hypothetical protein